MSDNNVKIYVKKSKENKPISEVFEKPCSEDSKNKKHHINKPKSKYHHKNEVVLQTLKTNKFRLSSL